MKKIIFSLIAISLVLGFTFIVLAEETNTNTNTNTVTSVTAKNKVLNSACIQKALDKKETAVIAALDKKLTALKAALEQRKKALIEAYGLTIRKDRLAARLKAWTNFRKTHLEIKKTYNNEVRTALNTFKTELKGCKSTDVYSVEQPAMLNDLNL